eukprot:CAMPEP_0119317862 /NCGR_PEP_ID=MMETSP1333-20130426/44616_1 /TAXON_ID=418940 /ORGANISM="Scyphosphaera apsteinii, Strain RCC1455" /LENGTH=120 /DNA_ID=CAMNT_0007323925 /DNA_START=214 /DNA_END=573 /DNA_ORIENTATION=-
MASEDCGRSVPFAFLEDIILRWINAYADRGQTGLAYGMNQEFSRVLQRRMDEFSRNTGVIDHISQVHSEIDEVRAVMVENIEKLLARGDKIELLVDKTEHLNRETFRFKKQSTAVKRVMW